MSYSVKIKYSSEIARGSPFNSAKFEVLGGPVPEELDRSILSDKYDVKGGLVAFAEYSIDDNRDNWFQIMILSENKPHLRYSKKVRGFPKAIGLKVDPLRVEVEYWNLEDGDQKVILDQFERSFLNDESI